jgi:hypothetical protein
MNMIEKTINLVFTGDLAVEFSIHILNIDGEGELETLLKQIKSKDSPIADCLDAWRQCLLTKEKNIKQKDFDKFWINVYQRFDTCSKQEQKQAGRKCNFEASLKKPIYDFDQPELFELKKFLKQLSLTKAPL